MMSRAPFHRVPTWFNSRLTEVLTAPAKAVLYFIICQTINWDKVSDRIALSQFEYGIGQTSGVGYTRPTIIKAINTLVALRFIEVERTWGRITTYKLRDDLVLPYVSPRASAAPAVKSVSETSKKRFTGTGKAASPTLDRPLTKDMASSDTRLPDTVSTHVAGDDDALDVTKTENDGESDGPLELAVESVADQTVPVADAAGSDRLSASSSVSHDAFEGPETHRSETPGVPANGPCEGQNVLPEPGHDKGPKVWPAPVTSDVNARPVQVAVESEDLFLRLVDPYLGFAPRKAAELISTYSRTDIESALDSIRQRHAQNPAGYLIAELKAGGFAPAKPPTRASVFRAPADFQLPKATSTGTSRPLDMRDPSSAESLHLHDAIVALDAQTRACIWQEARRACARVGRKTVEDDSPLLQAQFELLVLQRLGAGALQTTAA